MDCSCTRAGNDPGTKLARLAPWRAFVGTQCLRLSMSLLWYRVYILESQGTRCFKQDTSHKWPCFFSCQNRRPFPCHLLSLVRYLPDTTFCSMLLILVPALTLHCVRANATVLRFASYLSCSTIVAHVVEVCPFFLSFLYYRLVSLLFLPADLAFSPFWKRRNEKKFDRTNFPFLSVLT